MQRIVAGIRLAALGAALGLALPGPDARAADPAPLPRAASSPPASSSAVSSSAASSPESNSPGAAPDTPPDPEAAARAAAEAEAEADLFAMPRVAEQTRAAFGRIEAGDLDGAGEILDALAATHPGLGLAEANRATLAALRGADEAAIAALEAAAARGYDGIAALAADPLFAGIADDPRVEALVAAEAARATPAPAGTPDETDRAPTTPEASSTATPEASSPTTPEAPFPATEAPFPTAPEAPLAPIPGVLAAAPPPPRPDLPLAEVRDGVALVSGANTRWDQGAERLRTGFAFPARAAGPVVPDRKTAATDILREHWKRGRAAGNLGDLYDNRDRGHSALDPKDFPQLARTAYSPAARAADIDYGPNDQILFDAPVLGNSSTAITGGALWRSLPRLMLTRADGTGPLRLWQNAAGNALYVYPAHKDYGREEGDLFPANTPYLLVSHGSSGSDQPFLEALAMIYAAYRPDTKARLVAEGLLVPTTQMVFRRSLQTVRSRADYFGPAAHPSVFEGYDINLARMVSLANSIKATEIPPQVRIRVLSEDLGAEGVDWFGTGLSEQLFDTPAAVARIWRSRAFTKEITLDAGETADPNGRPLTFAWKLLAGDPGRVRITPAEDGRSARISIDWHEPFPISEDNPILTHRVDIGVFANNGAHDSAPAILSVFFPPDEARVYAPGPDGAERIVSIDYQGRPKAYADPTLLPRAGWRDDYHYDADGLATGWTRTRPGGAPAETEAATDADAPGETTGEETTGETTGEETVTRGTVTKETVTEEFDAAGRRILPGGATEAVAYPLSRGADGALVLGEEPAPGTTPGTTSGTPLGAP